MAEPNLIGGLVGGLLIGQRKYWRSVFGTSLSSWDRSPGAAVYSLIHGGLPLQLDSSDTFISRVKRAIIDG